MNKETLEFLVAKTEELIAVPYCCQELKDAAGNWLKAIGTDGEKAAAAAYVSELEEDVMPIDGTIEFFKSPAAAEHFGAENAAAMLAGLVAHKENGGKYCNCEACSAGAAVLEKKNELIG